MRNRLQFDPITLLSGLLAGLLPACFLLVILYLSITSMVLPLLNVLKEPHLQRVRLAVSELDSRFEAQMASLGGALVTLLDPAVDDLDRESLESRLALLERLSWYPPAPGPGVGREPVDPEAALRGEELLARLNEPEPDRQGVLEELTRLPFAVEDPVGFSYSVEARLELRRAPSAEVQRRVFRGAPSLDLATYEAWRESTDGQIPFDGLPVPLRLETGEPPVPVGRQALDPDDPNRFRVSFSGPGGGTLVASLPVEEFLSQCLVALLRDSPPTEGVYLSLDRAGEGKNPDQPWAVAEWPLFAPFHQQWQLTTGSVGAGAQISFDSLRRLGWVTYLWGGLLLLAAVVAASLLLAAFASRRVQLSRQKDDFVQLVSHELRTPIASIRMIAETLSLDRVRSEEERLEFLQQLEAESARLTDLAERVLEHGQRGKAGEHEVVTDPGELVGEAVRLFRQRHADAGEVQVRSAQEFHPVMLDREAVTGVVLNLLSNARKFSQADTPIEVTVGEESRHLFIEVLDHGPGLRRKELRRIFRPFYRGASRSRAPSFGLGLSYCQRVAESHRGHIRVNSTPGRGSLFTLEIPLSPAAREENRDAVHPRR